jgi:hypothetical protein
MKMAMALAYFDDIDEIANLVNLQDASNFIDRKMRSTGETPIFIFDDWNIFLDTTDARKLEAQEHLMAFDGCLKVFGISASCEHTRMLYGSEAAYKFILNGLTEAEWSIWKSSPSLANLAATIANKEKDDRGAPMTGLIPLLLTDLTGFVKKYNDLDVAIDQLVNVSDSPLNGSWVKDKLNEFYRKFDEYGKDEHVFLMARALGRLHCNTISQSLYDQRFFYLDDSETCLVPSCGVVEVQLALLLQSLERDRFLRIFNGTWASLAMRANTSNCSVRGFAFELYALAQLMVNLFRLLDSHIPEQFNGKKFPKIKVVQFVGDFPESTELNDSGCTCYLPTKWNLRHIDCAFRWVFTTRLAVDANDQKANGNADVVEQKIRSRASRATRQSGVGEVAFVVTDEHARSELEGKRKVTSSAGGDIQVKKVRTQETTVVCLYLVQVTLNAPKDHAKSLEVFTAKHERTTVGGLVEEQTDCSRYIKSSEAVVLKTLLWVLPSIATERAVPANVSDEKQVVLELLLS